jgi:hypothetical protein
VSLIALFLFILTAASLAYAQSLIPADPETSLGAGCDLIEGNVNARCVISFIKWLISWFVPAVGFYFLLMLLIGGYQIALGNVTGDKEGGKDRVKWAIIGFIITALSFFIIDFVISAISTGTAPTF